MFWLTSAPLQVARAITELKGYAPLHIDGLSWGILAEIDLAEAYAPIYSFRRQVLISATLLLLVVTLLAMGLAHVFVQPIQKLISSARRVAFGELETISDLATEDEFGELGQSFNASRYPGQHYVRYCPAL